MAGGKVDEKILHEIVRRIVEAVQPQKIILFGSAARDEMSRDSDVDLLVVKAGVHRRHTAQLLHRVLAGVGVPKDIVVATPQDLEQFKDALGLIYRSALSEGRTIYAA